ncbi:MAG: hypothetical protein CMG63_00050 [Candidatus Marinimicrobia bacterium]|nr:hypothetical protein [Candidatus Neomarinimicrobiota bacterium]
MVQKILNEEPIFNYELGNNRSIDDIRDIISDKVEEAIKNGTTKDIAHRTQRHSFPQIKVDRSLLLYNLENDRTLIATEEYIKANPGTDEEMFSNKNAGNFEYQNLYHRIIFKFIPDDMFKILHEKKFQRDPLFITSSGIVANGNTRLACMREFAEIETDEAYRDLTCLVVPDDKANDWTWIRSLVDELDNAVDFKSEYPWFSRARRFEKNCLEQNIPVEEILGTDHDEELTRISKKMEYKNLKESKIRYQMLVLAREFVEGGWALIKEGKAVTYEKLSDLSEIGASYGTQAFETLAKKYFHTDAETVVLDHLKEDSFVVIAKKKNLPHDFSSVHRAIEGIWVDRLVEIKKAEFSEIEDGFESESSSQNINTDAQTSFDRSDMGVINQRTKDILGPAYKVKIERQLEGKREAFQNKLRDIKDDVKFTRERILSDESDLEDAEKLLEELLKEISLTKDKVANISVSGG